MKQNIVFYLTVLAVVYGCSNSERVKSVEPKKISLLVSNRLDSLTTYREVPTFIKTYLDSLDKGQFLIANPDERWQAGCTAIKGEPRRQFIYAVISKQFFQMKYWQGGIAKVQMTFTASLNEGKIVLHQLN
jgi:hypothetical protein